MSNTRIKVLEVRLDQLSEERDSLENRQHRLRMRRKNEQKLMLTSYFHVSNDKFICDTNSGDSIRLKYADDPYGDIVTYNLDYNWQRDENGERATTSKIYHNGSTYKDVDMEGASFGLYYDGAITENLFYRLEGAYTYFDDMSLRYNFEFGYRIAN